MRRIAILSACLLAGVHLRQGRVLEVSAEDRLLLLSGGRARDALPGEEVTPEEEPEAGQTGATGGSGAGASSGQVGAEAGQAGATGEAEAGAEGGADDGQARLGV
ncbi:hypothetical protein KTR66_19390 [Roseococcus sp. SDR]|uniref:hypothetical protein n=1 Tax=Roseococcus sp. SDR TaxID=2835532 RepID=UPI001BD1906C|nr:hypothetical protein [Roseococcus sp. SDR]MBS7792172.1 hypothetical protein [Roseococcus sp. SDR]MBV1847486.1 hypothetical protein [Roseococcus sp. SDR]